MARCSAWLCCWPSGPTSWATLPGRPSSWAAPSAQRCPRESYRSSSAWRPTASRHSEPTTKSATLSRPAYPQVTPLLTSFFFFVVIFFIFFFASCCSLYCRGAVLSTWWTGFASIFGSPIGGMLYSVEQGSSFWTGPLSVHRALLLPRPEATSGLVPKRQHHRRRRWCSSAVARLLPFTTSSTMGSSSSAGATGPAPVCALSPPQPLRAMPFCSVGRSVGG